jgi:hypothetical protein
MDTDFMIMNALQRWSNGINDFDTNTGVNAMSDYATDLTAEFLDRDDTVLKTYIFKNSFPLTIQSGQALSMETDNQINSFDCGWQYQNYSISGVNF